VSRRAVAQGHGLKRAASRPRFLPWPDFRGAFADAWEQGLAQGGQHVTVLGPTGTGKSTLLIALTDLVAEASPKIGTIVLVTKRADRVLAGMQQRGWRVVRDASRRPEISYVKTEAHGRVIHPNSRRLIYWPTVSGGIKGSKAQQASAIRRVLDWAYAVGGWNIVADELLWLSDELRLGPELAAIWSQGRSSAISLLGGSQRPAWVPRLAYSSAEYLFEFNTNDKTDLDRLGDIGGGLDKLELRRTIQQLRRYEFAMIAPREPPPIIIRSKVAA
jgi:energy-coupling factor transporter ATP-binding protein EcfA2